MEQPVYGDQVNLLPQPSEALFYPSFFSPPESGRYLQYFMEDTPWIQEPVKMFGKLLLQPRLTAFFGDTGLTYTYSGLTVRAEQWTIPLLEIKRKIEEKCEDTFNTCLLNYYRDGKDYMGWHRDNEHVLGQYPVIASVSFGAQRLFQFRNYKEQVPVISLELENGSLLLMKRATQQLWEHRLPKITLPAGPRINLTFRSVELK